MAIDRDTVDLIERVTSMEAGVERLDEKVDQLVADWRAHDVADQARHAELKADVAGLDKRLDGSVGRLHGKLDAFIARIDEREKARTQWPGLGPAITAIPPRMWGSAFALVSAVVTAWLASRGIVVTPPPAPLDVIVPAAPAPSEAP